MGSAKVRKSKPKHAIKQKDSQIDFDDRVYTVEIREKEPDDDAFAEKLVELRVEHGKRELQRKFEELRRQETKGKKLGALGQAAGGGAAGSIGGGGFTTDHHGNVIQVQNAPNMVKQYETTVTVSEDQ